MEQNRYIPPNVLSPFKQRMGFLLRMKWVREGMLLSSTISGKRFSNKTEDYGVFKPSLISRLGSFQFMSEVLRKAENGINNWQA